MILSSWLPLLVVELQQPLPSLLACAYTGTARRLGMQYPSAHAARARAHATDWCLVADLQSTWLCMCAAPRHSEVAAESRPVGPRRRNSPAAPARGSRTDQHRQCTANNGFCKSNTNAPAAPARGSRATAPAWSELGTLGSLPRRDGEKWSEGMAWHGSDLGSRSKFEMQGGAKAQHGEAAVRRCPVPGCDLYLPQQRQSYPPWHSGQATGSGGKKALEPGPQPWIST